MLLLIPSPHFQSATVRCWWCPRWRGCSECPWTGRVSSLSSSARELPRLSTCFPTSAPMAATASAHCFWGAMSWCGRIQRWVGTWMWMWKMCSFLGCCPSRWDAGGWHEPTNSQQLVCVCVGGVGGMYSFSGHCPAWRGAGGWPAASQ